MTCLRLASKRCRSTSGNCSSTGCSSSQPLLKRPTLSGVEMSRQKTSKTCGPRRPSSPNALRSASVTRAHELGSKYFDRERARTSSTRSRGFISLRFSLACRGSQRTRLTAHTNAEQSTTLNRSFHREMDVKLPGRKLASWCGVAQECLIRF